MSSFADSVTMMTVTFRFINGLGYSLISTIACTATLVYFTAQRGLATSISTTGLGIGIVIFPFIIAFLVEQYLLSGALLIVAGE